MKIYYKKRHIKNIPKIYAEIEDICNYLDDFERKRLSSSERNALIQILMQKEFRLQLSAFLAYLKKTEPFIFSLIKNRKPVGVIVVKLRDGMYHMLDFGDKIQLRCPNIFWDLILNKSVINRLY